MKRERCGNCGLLRADEADHIAGPADDMPRSLCWAASAEECRETRLWTGFPGDEDELQAQLVCEHCGHREEAPSWPAPIPVTERVPEIGARVLALAEYAVKEYGDEVPEWIPAAHYKRRWTDDEGVTVSVTHWLPLPPKPEVPR